ncbi:MAG: DUF3025 domain-containing protein [Gallionella sp.]
MKQAPDWNMAALLNSPLFAPLQTILADLDAGDFPTLQNYNALLAASYPPITVQSGMSLRFVSQECGKLSFEAQYEPRCYLSGEVQMRAHNWHDLFNALVWLTFPKTKAMLNARHYHALLNERASGNPARGAARDANTLFDESGVIVVYADNDSGAELAGLVSGFRWKELFWQRREQVRAQMGFYLFGHGLYEKALQPYVGMTGQGLLLAVEQEYFSWSQKQQLTHLDNLLADYLAAPEHCRNTRDLSPVPLLGVPGWTTDNCSETYYDNTAYFRPSRRRPSEFDGRTVPD